VELYLQSPYTPPWRGAQLKITGTTLPLPYGGITYQALKPIIEVSVVETGYVVNIA
jgi:hypothetical protein